MNQTMRARSASAPSSRRVWLLSASVAAAAGGLTWIARDWGPIDPGVTVPWWALVLLFAAAERAVIHLRFRRDAHSFSMSEIPLVVGLFFAPPVVVVGTQALGNLVVLTTHRRQPPVKLAFNLSQFALQTGVAILVFRAIAERGDPLGPAGWLAAVAASLAAVAVADLLVNAAIRLAGGRLDRREVLDVLALTLVGATMNTILAIAAVLVLTVHPAAAWIAFLPPVVLYASYRAYLGQREERAGLEALYEVTRLLHASPQIEAALAAAADHARRMFDAELAEITIFPAAIDGVAYRTSSGPGNRRDVMRPISFRAEMPLWRRTLADPRPLLLSRPVNGIHVDGAGIVKDAMMAPLAGSRGMIGAVVVANRLGDVSTFGPDDLRLLETVAGQIGVSLENGRLEDSLAQLTVLKERLESLVRSKDEFVASVSHELRTPLTAVVGLAQELAANRAGLGDAELDELMAIIADQSSELSNIVEDLLVAARADVGTLTLHPAPIDIRAELEALAALVVPRLPDGNPIPIHGNAGEVVADPLRFRQIVRNLLTNAARYGGEHIWLEIRADGGRVTVAVLDDGLGVPEGSIDKIFEAYERAHNARSQPASVGLGLAVSRSLARLMGGDLGYRRRDGATEFSLTLPAGLPEAPVPSRPGGGTRSSPLLRDLSDGPAPRDLRP
jgi:signal transduction histidine kinase